MSTKSMPNALETHESQLRQRRAERIVIATGLLGVGVAAFALLWPSPEDGPSRITPIRPIAAPATSPEPAASPAAVETTAVDAGAFEVVASVPVVALSTDDPSTDFLAQSRIAVAGGDVEGALVALRKHLFRAAPTAPVLMDVARLASATGQYALAEQALLDAGALEPTNAEIAVERGRLLLEAGELASAREAARQAIRLDRESPSAWNIAGRVAMAESQWERAEMAFRQAVQRDPTDPMLHNNLGLLYVLMRKADLAVDALETSRELYGDDAPAFVHNNLGLAYEQAHRLADARDAFADALTVLPDYSRAQVNLRRVLAAEQAASEAAEHAERRAELAPSLELPAAAVEDEAVAPAADDADEGAPETP